MDTEFNPHDEFFCALLKKRMPYYDCKYEQENDNEKCDGCLTGEENLSAIEEYEAEKPEKPRKKRGRPKGCKTKKLTVIEHPCNAEDNQIEPVHTECAVIPYQENSMVICLDFTQHSQLFGQIKKLAKRDFRDIDKQVMYMLNTWIDIDKKYEQAKRSAVARGMLKLNGNTKT